MDDLDQLEACRICVTCFPIQEMDFIYIFLKNQEFQQELDFIQGEIRQWQLKIQPDDGLPQRICANCFAKFCSIEAFRRECEQAQVKLIETLLQQQDDKEFLNITQTPLPLVGNYESGAVSIEEDPTVLVSSVNLTQSEVCLNDFPVFDQQFAHYDNPALMDASATLLDSDLIAPETTNDLGFLPSQNLFTFETAEPPTTGTTLPLADVTDTTSIINDLLDGTAAGMSGGQEEHGMKQDDLENLLQRSIIPTSTKLNIQINQNESTTTGMKKTEDNRTEIGNQYRRDTVTKGKYDFQNIFNTSSTTSHHYQEDNFSDNECDESRINARLKDLPHACHYCYCPDTGTIDHLIFQNEDALSQHFFDVHEPNRPYTCPHCDQSYKTQLLRDNHVKVLHKVSKLQTCDFCLKRLRGSMEVHQYNCQYIGDWECNVCNEKFNKTALYRFRLHQRQHEKTKNLKCRLCDRTFMKKANLEAHQRMHKTELKATHKCNICNGHYVSDYELKRHKYQQHSGEAPVKCKICNKGFATIAFLQRHITQLHPTSKSIVSTPPPPSSSSSSSSQLPTASPPQTASRSPEHICLNCNNVFKSIQKLQNHLLVGRDADGKCLYTIHNKQERRKIQLQGLFPCFHCPRRFHMRSQLDKHLNTHDARLRPFQCEQCIVRCRTAFELKQHVNVIHLNIKAFPCDKCGKCFGYKKDLRDHMLFHAEINVHCTEDDCNYVCKNDKALNDHIRHKHRLLSCEYCQEQFTRQRLTSHLRNVHRSEIDMELATESDNFYKSQLLNNNNDITQISFNLLNTQIPQQKITTSSSSSISSHSSVTPPLISMATICNNNNCTNNNKQLLASPTSSSTTTSSSSSASLSSCLTNTKCNSSTLTAATSSLSNQNMNDVDDPRQQLCSMFVNDNVDDPNDTQTTLALNDLNLVTNDASSIFLVPSASSTTNVNNLDQYFMASLIDTEQEITVT